MYIRKRLPNQLATDAVVNNASADRFTGGDMPEVRPHRHLASDAELPARRVSAIGGCLNEEGKAESTDWPEFRKYAYQKYPDVLEGDLITMIEDLIERGKTLKQPRKAGRRKALSTHLPPGLLNRAGVIALGAAIATGVAIAICNGLCTSLHT